MKITVSSLILCAAAAFMLGGCGENPEERITELLGNGETREAISWIDAQIAEDPQNKLLHGLAAESKLSFCIATDCSENHPELLTQLRQHIIISGDEAQRDDDTTRQITQNLQQMISRLPQTTEGMLKRLSLTSYLPVPAIQQQLTAEPLQSALDALKTGNIEDARAIYMQVKELATDNEALYSVLSVYLALLDGTPLPEQETETFRGRVSSALLEAFPYILLIHQQTEGAFNGIIAFATALDSLTQNIPHTLLKGNTALRIYGRTLAAMAMNDTFLAAHTRPQDALTPPATGASTLVSSTTDEGTAEDSMAKTSGIQALPAPTALAEDLKPSPQRLMEARLTLLKQSLVLDPDNQAAWNAFLQPAMNYVDETGRVDLLFSDIDASKIPASAAEPYNERLFKLIEAAKAEGDSTIVALLNRIILPENPTQRSEMEERINRFVGQSITEALRDENIELLVAFAAFRPELVVAERQRIIRMVLERVDTLWAENNFEAIPSLLAFLIQHMNIDLNSDTYLTGKFNAWVEEQGILAKLKADDAAVLKQPQQEVRFDLGEKFAFKQRYFADKPEQINSLLRQIVLRVGGTYGAPVAFYRLYHLFDDTTFAQSERNAFLIGAMQQALSTDDNLNALQLHELALALKKNHPELSDNFIINETLRRVDNIEQARAIWQQHDSDYQATIKNLRPQFGILMEAVDAHEAGDYAAALEAFSLITEPTYITNSAPYFEAYQKPLLENDKAFFSTASDDNMRVALLQIESLNPQSLQPANLLDARITLVNAVGSVMIAANRGLNQDYGQVFTYQFETQLNPQNNILPVTEEMRAAARLSQSFERTFGEITGIELTDTGPVIITANEKRYPFAELAADLSRPVFPDGRFGFTEQKSIANKNTDHVLPTGSILTLKTDRKKPLQPIKDGRRLSIIFPVEGELLHPASPEPRPVKGFYSLRTHTTLINYDYPLQTGRGVLDAVTKCQIMKNYILCGAHNKHWSRTRYNHLIAGRRAEQSEATVETQQNSTEDIAPVEQIEGDMEDLLERESTPKQSERTEMLPPPLPAAADMEAEPTPATP